MEIATFLVNEPDDDGDMRMEIRVDVPNSTDQDIHRAKTRLVFFNSSGAPVGSADDESDVRVEPGEGFSVEPWASVKSVMCGEARDDITCRAVSFLMRRELLKLGDVAVPPKHGVYVTHESSVDSASVQPRVLATVLRGPPDDSGDVSLEIRAAVRNVSSSTLEAVTLSAELLDEDDAEAASNDDTTNSLDAGMDALLSVGMYAKKGVMKGARIRLKLSIFHRVAQLSCDATSSPA